MICREGSVREGMLETIRSVPRERRRWFRARVAQKWRVAGMCRRTDQPPRTRVLSRIAAGNETGHSPRVSIAEDNGKMHVHIFLSKLQVNDRTSRRLPSHSAERLLHLGPPSGTPLHTLEERSARQPACAVLRLLRDEYFAFYASSQRVRAGGGH